MIVLDTKRKTRLTDVSLSHDGRYALAMRYNYGFVVWDRNKGTLLSKKVGVWNDGDMQHAMLLPTKNVALVWGADGVLSLPVPLTDMDGTDRLVNYVCGLAVTPDGERAFGVVLEKKETCISWTITPDGEFTEQWRMPAFDCNCLVPWFVCPNGKYVAGQEVIDRGETLILKVVLFDTVNRTMTRMPNPPGKTMLLGILNDGRPFVQAASKLLVWNPLTKAFDTVVKFPIPGPVGAVAVSPDGRRLLVAQGKEPTVHLMTVEDFAIEKTVSLPVTGVIGALAFSPDGLTAIAGTSKGMAAVWDIDQ